MTTKRRAKNNYRWYLESDMHSIYEAYGRPSERKEAAWEYCRRLCSEYGGRGLKVISKNAQFFTAGFVFGESEKEMFMYITANYNVCVPVAECVAE